MITSGMKFNIEFSANRLDLIFEAVADRGQSPVFGRPFHENGLLRFRREEGAALSMLLLFAPFDMISSSDAEIHRAISDVEAVPIKGFVIQARLDQTNRETRAVMTPSSISEEGVEFEFQETERHWIGGSVSMVSAEEILADIFISDSLSISLFNGGKPIMRTYSTIEFDHLDDFRSAVATAFGNEFAVALAARHGYEIDE